MRQSFLFTKTRKEAPADEVSKNAQLLIRAGFIDKLMAGVYTILPLGLRVMNKIENIIREEMDIIGGQELFMPTLQPKDNWMKTGRWENMDDLYKVADMSEREFALGPTHEEVIVPLIKTFTQSYRDLPLYVYQFQNKFRMEMRSKSGILRGREFMMKDLYSFHIDGQNLDEYYEKAKNAYFKIFKRTGIGEKTYLTFASGGSFSKYSHEFQTVTSAGEDTIYICTKCNLAINREIKEETPACPDCGSTKFNEDKAIEVGNIFKLMNKYTKPFDFTVKNEQGEETEVLMGCYGIGLGRLMGTIVEVYHDDQGILWPQDVAPFQVHLISLCREKEHIAKAEEIYQQLGLKGIEVLFDDRPDVRAGEKFADSDLIGIPKRIVVSARTLEQDSVEVKMRNEKENRLVKIASL